MQLPHERLVFADIKTAGRGIACPIIQIGAVAVDSRLRELETFEVKIRFPAEVWGTEVAGGQLFRAGRLETARPATR